MHEAPVASRGEKPHGLPVTAVYPISEAQSKLRALFEEAAEHPVCVRDGERVLGYIVSPESSEDWEMQIETAELVDSQEAMKAIRAAHEDKVRYHDLSTLEEA